MKTLIVGCGYAGTALGAELIRLGHEVFGLRRNSAAADGLKQAGIHPLLGDLTRREDLEQLPGPFDWVVNTVSSSHGGVEDYREIYLMGMRNLVRWLQATPPQKFVYTSSTGVYGQEDGSWISETSATEPRTDTGQVLLRTEQVALMAAREHGLPVVILRASGIYGPGRGYLFKQFVSGEAKLIDQGQRISNMVHRDDLVGCILAALERGKPGAIYNASDDEPVTHLEFYRWLAAELGSPMPPVAEEPAALPSKRGLSNKRIANRKLKEDLNYRFKYPNFRDGYGAEIQRLKSSPAQ